MIATSCAVRFGRVLADPTGRSVGMRSGSAVDIERQRARGAEAGLEMKLSACRGTFQMAGSHEEEDTDASAFHPYREMAAGGSVLAGAEPAGKVLGESLGPGRPVFPPLSVNIHGGSGRGQRARVGAWLALCVCLAAATLPGVSGACTGGGEVNKKRCTDGVMAASYDTNEEATCLGHCCATAGYPCTPNPEP